MTTEYNFSRIAPVPEASAVLSCLSASRTTPRSLLRIRRRPSPWFSCDADWDRPHRPWYRRCVIRVSAAQVRTWRRQIVSRLEKVLRAFPDLDDVHPFFADLINVQCDRDIYRQAVGRVESLLRSVNRLARTTERLLPTADSRYRCTELTRAALEAMVGEVTRNAPALQFLKGVRECLVRLPCLDPSSPTLLVTGFPNVGKSSFVNIVTRADVEVQPYPFTTKSLFVGRMQYKLIGWQVIDTPGILDHALEERNVIEMQAITALAHLRATILFVMDLSGQCGYTIAQQLSLFHSIRPLFTGKPLVVVLNKCDVATLDVVSASEHDAVMSAIETSGAKWIATSTLTDIGVGDLKTLACEALLAHRAEQKAGTARYESMQNRLYCAEPKKRDNLKRGNHIPESVLEAREIPEDERVYRKTERDLEWENGGPGQYQYNERLTWDLENPEWVDDIMPEFMDGKNVADFIDPDILERLDELEAEEERRIARAEMEETKATNNTYSLQEATQEAVSFIRNKIKILRMERAMRNPAITRTRPQQAAIDKFNNRTGSQSSARGPADGKKRGRSLSAHAEEAFARERSGSHVSTKSTRSLSGRTASRDRTMSVTRGEGFKDVSQKLRAVKLAKIKARPRAREAKKGEADRAIPNVMPKHLFSGKMKVNGKRDRR